MSELIFTPDNSSLSPITVNGTIIYGTDHSYERKNQQRRETIDGTDIVYDRGPSIGYGILMIKQVSYAEGVAFREWIRDTIIFQKELFSILPPSNTDVGGGKGVQVDDCRLLSINTDEMFEFLAPGIYSITLKYKFPIPIVS
jgi:hypothetical protein